MTGQKIARYLARTTTNLKIFTVLLIIVTFGLATAKFVFASTLVLSGTVQDSLGNPISGASISVSDSNGDTTTTDSAGYYSMSVSSGVYDVKVSPPSGGNFSSAIAYSQSLTADTTLNFVLTAAGTAKLSGHLYDGLGNPLAHQTVSISVPGSNPAASAVTGADGYYTLTGAPGKYTISISNMSAKNTDFSQNIPEAYNYYISDYGLTQDVMQDISLPVKKVAVHVQDETIVPLSDVMVTTNNGFGFNVSLGGGTYNASGNDYYFAGQGPRTDTSGNTTLWLFASSYDITATPPNGGYMPTTLSNVSVTIDTQVNIALRKPVTLTGHLYDESGHPLTGQPIALASSGSQVATATTDATGYYSLTAAPGTYTIQVSRRSTDFSQAIPPSYDFYVSNFSLSQNTQQDITLPARKVSFHVQDAAGSPVAGAQINTSNGFNLSESLGGNNYNVSGSNYYFSGQSPVTDSSGNVTLWLFASTGYSLTVLPPSGSSLTAKTLTNVSISSDTQQTVVLTQPVTFSGYLYDEGGSPLINQTVALQVPGNNPSATATTDSSGYYSLTAQTGVYNISISNMSAKNTDFSQNIPEAYNYYISNYSLTQNTQQNITLPAREVKVHVQDGQNNPASGIQLTTTNGFNFNTSLGGASYNASGEDYYFSGQGPSTDNSGNAVLWLFASTYDVSATPPSGSIYSPFTLSNLSVSGDQNVVISLQYSHSAPLTNVTLSPAPNANGVYADPVSVTLSASAASGYSVANTYYTLDGGSQQTYTSPIAVTGSGDHTLTYWSVDNSGVVESAKTKTFTIHQPPAISTLTKGTVDEGSPFTENGSITSDAASLTATVDYGEGLGAQPLTLSGTNFTLSHTYGEEGTYTVAVVVTDNDGLTANATTTVTVNNAPFTVGAITGIPATPIVLDTSGSATVNAAATISDPGISDTHTAVWDWGDGSALAAATISEKNGAGNVTGSHTYTAPGVYVVTVAVTDDDGLKVTQTFRYASVENPYVPGSVFSAGVKYDSPVGADVADSTLTGPVKFAIQVWFKQSTGTIDPSSKVEMNFAAGNIDFVSTGVSEFISANGSGTVEGAGTIDGIGNYTFLATGIDGQQSGGNTVRFKIMDAAGNVIYDSQPGAADNAAPTTPITAGRVNVK